MAEHGNHETDQKEDANAPGGSPGPADPARAGVTGEVGGDGGTPGDVELDIDRGP